MSQRPDTVDFHFDVMCPYAYQTSLWIRSVRERTGLVINWRFFSLEEVNRVEGKKHPWERDWSYGWSMMRVGALLRRRDMAELDAWYARAYGLTRDELRYILDPADVMGPDYPSQTFRVLRDNEERKFGEYRTRRLVLDAWDRMERGELPKPEPYQRPATEPTTISAAAPRRAPAHDTSAQPGLQFTESDAE